LEREATTLAKNPQSGDFLLFPRGCVRAFLCSALLVAAGLGARAADAAPAEVRISNFTFDPPTLTVPVGATVTWTNRDDEPHTVTSTGGGFTSPALDTDESFSFRFDAAGSYAYHCAIHPHMTGTIVVR
jgi:plastocyanin